MVSYKNRVTYRNKNNCNPIQTTPKAVLLVRLGTSSFPSFLVRPQPSLFNTLITKAVCVTIVWAFPISFQYLWNYLVFNTYVNLLLHAWETSSLGNWSVQKFSDHHDPTFNKPSFYVMVTKRTFSMWEKYRSFSDLFFSYRADLKMNDNSDWIETDLSKDSRPGMSPSKP